MNLTKSEICELFQSDAAEAERVFGPATLARFFQMLTEALHDEDKTVSEQLTNADLEELCLRAVAETRPDLLPV